MCSWGSREPGCECQLQSRPGLPQPRSLPRWSQNLGEHQAEELGHNGILPLGRASTAPLPALGQREARGAEAIPVSDVTDPMAPLLAPAPTGALLPPSPGEGKETSPCSPRPAACPPGWDPPNHPSAPLPLSQNVPQPQRALRGQKQPRSPRGSPASTITAPAVPTRTPRSADAPRSRSVPAEVPLRPSCSYPARRRRLRSPCVTGSPGATGSPRVCYR